MEEITRLDNARFSIYHNDLLMRNILSFVSSIKDRFRLMESCSRLYKLTNTTPVLSPCTLEICHNPRRDLEYMEYEEEFGDSGAPNKSDAVFWECRVWDKEEPCYYERFPEDDLEQVLTKVASLYQNIEIFNSTFTFCDDVYKAVAEKFPRVHTFEVSPFYFLKHCNLKPIHHVKSLALNFEYGMFYEDKNDQFNFLESFKGLKKLEVSGSDLSEMHINWVNNQLSRMPKLNSILLNVENRIPDPAPEAEMSMSQYCSKFGVRLPDPLGEYIDSIKKVTNLQNIGIVCSNVPLVRKFFEAVSVSSISRVELDLRLERQHFKPDNLIDLLRQHMHTNPKTTEMVLDVVLPYTRINYRPMPPPRPVPLLSIVPPTVETLVITNDSFSDDEIRYLEQHPLNVKHLNIDNWDNFSQKIVANLPKLEVLNVVNTIRPDHLGELESLLAHKSIKRLAIGYIGCSVHMHKITKLFKSVTVQGEALLIEIR